MKRSILLVDDYQLAAETFGRALSAATDVMVVTESDGRRARLLAERTLFDSIIIDAKLDYRGVHFGGLRLAEDLRNRYGSDSILIISRYKAVEEMESQQSVFPFLDKPTSQDDLIAWTSKLCGRIAMMHDNQYAFVAMPFKKGLELVYRERIKPAVEAGGMRCVRADELPYTKGLADRIVELVSNCKLLIAVADDANPNAYYETGIADGLNKQVILVVKRVDDLRSDLRHRFAVTYSTSKAGCALLQQRLTALVKQLRLSEPVGMTEHK